MNATVFVQHGNNNALCTSSSSTDNLQRHRCLLRITIVSTASKRGQTLHKHITHRAGLVSTRGCRQGTQSFLQTRVGHG